MSVHHEHGLEIATLADGAGKLLENATSLFNEAVALLGMNALSRCFCLHQLSLEECAKIEMLGALAASTLMGHRVDLRKFAKAFASHKAKNYTNAYFLPSSEAEADAREGRRWSDSIQAFREMQEEFHSESNTAKNASLYVDFRAGRFFAPKDRIHADMADSIGRLNQELLASSEPKVRLLRRWADNPDQTREQMGWMTERLMGLRNETDDPETALRSFLDDVLTRFKPAG